MRWPRPQDNVRLQVGNLGESLDICHSFPKSQPFGFGGFAGFLFSVDLEIGRIVDCGFNPEDAPLFIVEFDGVTLESVFDPYSLRTVFEIGNEFSGEARGIRPVGGMFFPRNRMTSGLEKVVTPWCTKVR